MTARGLIIGGTTSDAGKSLVATGLCRWLTRRGHRVAPFKAQNMSNNSMVVPGGAEIGRAQWLQASAANVTPTADMNPVLLKPGSDLRSHIVLRGQPWKQVHSDQWHEIRPRLKQVAFEALEDLRADHDYIIAEGAGSPAEINLRAGDFTNLGLAEHTRWPMLVVGDIDRGGVLAAFYGTVSILAPSDQELVAGWIVNKFRGHLPLLQPGLKSLHELTGRPNYGVIRHLDAVWVDGEDSLEVGRRYRNTQVDQALTVAVVRFPRISNSTDVDALAAEPGVNVTVVRDAASLDSADVVVLPGSRETISDLKWLHDTGLAAVIERRARQQKPILGICGGYQMLAKTIVDTVESNSGTVSGLDLLPTQVHFHSTKTLQQPIGTWQGHQVTAYEIHHGVATVNPDARTHTFLDGCHRDAVWGTTWHGTFENDDFRRAWLAAVAKEAGVNWKPDPSAPTFADLRNTMIDTIADTFDTFPDPEAIMRLLDHGLPTNLPTRIPGLS